MNKKNARARTTTEFPASEAVIMEKRRKSKCVHDVGGCNGVCVCVSEKKREVKEKLNARLN